VVSAYTVYGNSRCSTSRIHIIIQPCLFLVKDFGVW
jgi:hypothetical protein